MMSEDLGIPAEAEQGTVAIDPQLIGVWRQGDLLVIRLGRYRLPRRCVKTNLPFEGEPMMMAIDWIPHHGIWMLMFGAMGHVLAKAMFGKTVSLQLPVSRDWLARYRRVKIAGWSLIVGGIVSCVLTTVVAIGAITMRWDDRIYSLLMGVVCISPLVALLGLVFLFFFHKPIATARMLTDEFVWLDRIDAGFLWLLPEWPGLRSASAEVAVTDGV